MKKFRFFLFIVGTTLAALSAKAVVPSTGTAPTTKAWTENVATSNNSAYLKTATQQLVVGSTTPQTGYALTVTGSMVVTGSVTAGIVVSTGNFTFQSVTASTITATSSFTAVNANMTTETVANETVTNSTTTSAVISTATINGQIVFNDGTLRSANTNFIVGFSSYTNLFGSSSTSNASTFVPSNITTTYTLKKSTNKIILWATGTMGNDTANDGCDLGFFKDSTFISQTNGGQRVRNPSAAVLQQSPFSLILPYAPGDTSSHTYTLGFRATQGGTCTLNAVLTADSPLVIFDLGQ